MGNQSPLDHNVDSWYRPVNLSNQIGLHLWYALDDHTIQQLSWRDDDKTERLRRTGQASIPTQYHSWGPGTTTYVRILKFNQNGTLQIWA